MGPSQLTPSPASDSGTTLHPLMAKTQGPSQDHGVGGEINSGRLSDATH